MSKSYLARLQSHDIEYIQQNVYWEIKDDQTRRQIAGMSSLFPSVDPIETKMIDFNFSVIVTRDDMSKTVSFSSEYEYPDRWLVANIVLRTTGNLTKIIGMNVTSYPEPIEKVNEFYFSTAFTTDYVVLFAAVTIGIVTAWALISCLLARNIKWWWKLPWAVFIAAGFTTIQLNWTTAAVTFSPFFVSIPSIQYAKTPYSPMVLTISIPLGALLFLTRRYRRRRAEPPEVDPGFVTVDECDGSCSVAATERER